MSLELFGIDTHEERGALIGAVVAAVGLPLIWTSRKVLAVLTGGLLVGPLLGAGAGYYVRRLRGVKRVRLPDGTVKEIAPTTLTSQKPSPDPTMLGRRR